MKILLVDIETTPNLAYVWGKYEQNVIEFKAEWQLLSYAYRWLGKGPVLCETREGEKSDKRLTERLWHLFDKADIIIAHNGDAFDIRKSKAKFVEHGLPPPSPFKTIDTKKIAKSAFKFNSNSLDDLGNLLQVGRKMKHQGFELWKGCMRNDPKAWKIMVRYNKQDIVLLEKVYKKLRGWSKTGPLNHLVSKEECPRCASKNTTRHGFVVNNSGTYQKFHCQDCGGISRALKPVLKSQSKLRSVA